MDVVQSETLEPTISTDLLEELVDLFPHVPRDVLSNLLISFENDSTKSIDYLLNGGSLDEFSSPVNEGYDYKVKQLREIFGQLDVDLIKRYLEDNDDDIERTTEDLLNCDVVEELAKTSLKETNTKSIQDEFTQNVIDLEKLTGLSESIIETQLRKFHGNSIKALINIIKTPSNKENIPSVKEIETSSQIPTGGRVQGLYPKRQTRGNIPKQKKPKETTYIYDETKPEAKELAEFVFQDECLVDISWNFYVSALTFFKGEVFKVISVAIYLYENNGIEATYDQDDYTKPKFSELFKDINQINPNDEFQTVIPKKKTYVSNPLIPSSVPNNLKPTNLREQLEKRQQSLQRSQLTRAKEFSCIDLHNFHIKNAKVAIEKALTDWWEDELKQREISGKSTSGNLARELEPFVIITGKGIHSDAGKSKIRHSTKSYLIRNNYIFEELTSQFIVKGKR